MVNFSIAHQYAFALIKGTEETFHAGVSRQKLLAQSFADLSMQRDISIVTGSKEKIRETASSGRRYLQQVRDNGFQHFQEELVIGNRGDT